MAKFKAELPNYLLKKFEELEMNTGEMTSRMLSAAGKVVHEKVKSRMTKAFDPNRVGSLMKGLKVSRVYETPSDESVNIHIGFYGYDGVPTKQYSKGTPIPLKAMAREYGTSRGEKKVPFFRQAFAKKDIEQAMLEVQESYIGED